MRRWKRGTAVLVFVTLTASGCVQAEHLSFLEPDDDAGAGDPTDDPAEPADDDPARAEPQPPPAEHDGDEHGAQGAPALPDEAPNLDLSTPGSWTPRADPPRSGEYLVEAGGEVEVQSPGDVGVSDAHFAAVAMWPGSTAQGLIFALEVHNDADDHLADYVVVHVSAYAADGSLVAMGRTNLLLVEPDTSTLATGWLDTITDEVTTLRVQTRPSEMIAWRGIPGGLEVTDAAAAADPLGFESLEVTFRSTYDVDTGHVAIAARGLDAAGELVAVAERGYLDGVTAGAEATALVHTFGEVDAVDRWDAVVSTHPRDLGS